MENILEEYILGPNCHNNCVFCHQRKFKPLSENEKIDCIRQIKQRVESIDINQVLLVGGELFDEPFSKVLDYEFFSLVKLLGTKVDLFYVNTNLIYKKLDLVLKFLELVPDFTKLRFTTSFDPYYRFKTDADKDQVLLNIDTLKLLYPEIRIIKNTILTKDVCKDIIDRGRPDSDTCLIPCVKAPKIAPTRNEIFRALNSLDKNYITGLLGNFTTDQKRRLYSYENGKLEICTSEDASCGHNVNFSMYCLDNTTCFICDLEKLVNLD